MNKFFLIVFKIFLLAIIVIAGGGITCGGNILLSNIIQYFIVNISDIYGILLWGIEILTISIFGIRFLFFSTYSGDLKKLIIITLLLSIICGGIFLVLCGGINIF